MSQTTESVRALRPRNNSMPRHRPWHKAAMHWIRRLHLYSGLFLFPWVAEETTDTLTTRTLLLRLHLAYGFPASVNARWFWAIVVDAMFLAMVFWGLSGVVMFWQIKAVRG